MTMHQNTDMPVYPAIDRRAKPDEDSMLFIVQAIHQKVEDLDKRLTQQTHDATLQLAEEITALMCKAFPGEDPIGHRRLHEEQMKASAARAEFWRKMLFEISRGGLLGFLGWAVYALWKAFLVGPK